MSGIFLSSTEDALPIESPLVAYRQGGQGGSCRTCCWAHPDQGTLYCHARPPQAQAVVHMVPVPPSALKIVNRPSLQPAVKPEIAGIVSFFPRVEPEWFCGEYEDRIPNDMS